MKETIPNFFAFIDYILTTGLNSKLTAVNELTAHEYENVPLLSWTYLNQGQSARGIWEGTLVLNLICEAADVNELTAAVYQHVRKWDTPGNGVHSASKVGVESVSDGAVFDLISMGALNGKNVLHLTSSFSLTVRDWAP